MIYELYNNTLCVKGRNLYDGPTAVMTKFQFENMLKRKKCKRVRRGGNGGHNLIAFDSIDPDIREIIVEVNGDPNKSVKGQNNFISHYEHDFKGELFFKEYKLNNGEFLPEGNIRQYTCEASLLNTVKTVLNNRIPFRQTLNQRNTKDVLQNILHVIQELPRHIYPHSLPENLRRFKEKYNQYNEKGYEFLIHRNFANVNAEILNDSAKLWVLSRWADQVQRCTGFTQLWKEYNKEALVKGWKQLKDKGAIENFLKLEHVKPLWWGHRYGSIMSKEKFMYQHTTVLPSMRDSLWYGDGTKLNYFYQYVDKEGKTQMGTCQVYEVMDAFSEVLLGYHISNTEDYEAQYFSFKNAIKFAGYRPYQIVTDNQGGHKKLTTGNFFNKISRLSIRTQPHNGKSKTIESAFGRFQMEHLKKDWFFTGQNIQAKRQESKANMEVILANKHNLPTLDEVKATYAIRREEWNIEKHYDSGISKIEMYRNSSNPKTQTVGILDMVEMFWVEREKPITVTPYGINFTEKKIDYQFMVYEAGTNIPDMEWLANNIDKKLYVKFDPEDMTLIHLYEKDSLGLRFYVQAETKVTVHRGIQEQEEYENQWMAKIAKKSEERAIMTRDKMESILYDHGATIEQQGLNRPRLLGTESPKKNKTERVRTPRASKVPDEMGQYLKEMSNRVAILADGTEETNIYDLY